jgi:putative cardiolipin synthase
VRFSKPGPSSTSCALIPPVVADRIGLHAKVFIVDREITYVGTLNLDPRSFEINTEIGVVVRSPPLAETIQSTFERDMRPDNSWRVEIDEDGRLRWTSTAGVKHIQPAHSFTQRLADFFLQMLPVEEQL